MRGIHLPGHARLTERLEPQVIVFPTASQHAEDHRRHHAERQEHEPHRQRGPAGGVGLVAARDDHPHQDHQHENLDHDLRDRQVRRTQQQKDQTRPEPDRPDADDAGEEVAGLNRDQRAYEHKAQQREQDPEDGVHVASSSSLRFGQTERPRLSF